jgi:DnaJ domain
MKRIDPWKVLNVRPGDTEEYLKTSYRKLMITCHPDHGGDEEVAKKINLAYEFLSNRLINELVPTPEQAGVFTMPTPVRVVRYVIVNSTGPNWQTSTTTNGWWY